MSYNEPLADIGAVIHKRRMKIATLLAALFALLVHATPGFAQTTAASSTEDRQRFVSIVHRLESDPLSSVAQRDRAWAITWLQDAPDVSVHICADPLGNLVSEKGFAPSSDILVQYVLAMGAFIVENPSKADDIEAQQVVGVESALTAYRAMRAARTDQQSPAMEKLLALQSQGELPDFVRKAYRGCVAKNGK